MFELCSTRVTSRSSGIRVFWVLALQTRKYNLTYNVDAFKYQFCMICDISVMWYSLRNVNHVNCLFVWWMLWCLNSLFTSVKILSSSLHMSRIFRLKKLSFKRKEKCFQFLRCYTRPLLSMRLLIKLRVFL